MNKIAVFMADGMEEVECLTVVDIARRAGIEAKTVSIGRREVTGSHGITVAADELFNGNAAEGCALIVLPGGARGVANMAAHDGLMTLVKDFCAKGGRAAAICAAPSLLGCLGLLRGRQAVCYPGWEDRLEGALLVESEVATDGPITTGRGMGCSTEFALEIVRLLEGDGKAQEIKKQIQYRVI